MRKTIKFTRIITLLMTFFMLTGCAETQTGNNSLDDVQNESVTESQNDGIINENITSETQPSSTESAVMENSSEDDQKIQYYDTLDSHMQLLYDAFLSCNWTEVNDTIEEFKKPDEERVAVYTTPSDGLSLVIEYLPEARSWQAYLGEFADGQKKGMGVMVSKRGTGYVSDNVYIGTWNNNLPNGTGMLSDSVYDMEYIFAGTFVDGKFDSAIQVYELQTPELYVDYLSWETFYTVGELNYADLAFDNGKPIPVTMDIVEQYIEISKLTAHELKWLELENDGQYYYRIYNERYNYIFTVGAKPPADGYRGDVNFIYGTFFDLNDEEATYGVACYTTNRMD